MSRVKEGDPIMLDRKTGDRPPGDLVRSPLKEVWEECVPQIILNCLKFHTYGQYEAMHEGPLLLEVPL